MLVLMPHKFSFSQVRRTDLCMNFCLKSVPHLAITESFHTDDRERIEGFDEGASSDFFYFFLQARIPVCILHALL